MSILHEMKHKCHHFKVDSDGRGTAVGRGVFSWLGKRLALCLGTLLAD